MYPGGSPVKSGVEGRPDAADASRDPGREEPASQPDAVELAQDLGQGAASPRNRHRDVDVQGDGFSGHSIS